MIRFQALMTNLLDGITGLSVAERRDLLGCGSWILGNFGWGDVV